MGKDGREKRPLQAGECLIIQANWLDLPLVVRFVAIL